MSELTAIWEGEFKIGDKTIKAYVLSNGQRVIDQASLIELFGMSEETGQTFPDEDLEAFCKFVSGRGVPR